MLLDPNPFVEGWRVGTWSKVWRMNNDEKGLRLNDNHWIDIEVR
jgi:hypothetical protein